MFNNMTPVVKQLLIINVLVFILSQAMPQNYETLSLFYFESEKFRFWQPFTHMFMHAPMPNLMHILFNMFALVSFGSALEHYWGGKKFLFFYIACGLGAAFLHTLINYYLISNVPEAADVILNSQAVGASGAIYGLLVAFAVMFPMAELMMMFIPVPIKAKFFVPIIIGLDLFSGVTGFSIFSGGGNIAHFAHIGGALTGFILMMLWRKNKFTHTRWN
ncbi:rhomboid family intramembrane serine protease [Flavobacterium sp.]|uniref:rhomboid family intramembrane serine protease n=1 Tax=Flavobacterium sp. TaxID=239 RepID=UPI003341CE96